MQGEYRGRGLCGGVFGAVVAKNVLVILELMKIEIRNSAELKKENRKRKKKIASTYLQIVRAIMK